MTGAEFCVRGGTIVTGDGMRITDVQVRSGRIAEVGRIGRPEGSVIDAGGLLIFPGMVDTHVHFMDPGDTSREDFPTGTAAAAAAGVTTVIEHTHASPVLTVDDLEAKISHLNGRSNIDFGLAAHVFPLREEPLEGLWRAGIAFFKIFLCTSHGIPGLSFADLHSVLSELARFGGVALVHAEEESLTAHHEDTLRSQGRSDPAILPLWRSRTAELVGTQGAVLLALLAGAKVGIAHVSDLQVLELIEQMKAKGADVGAEACPQYFILHEDEVQEHGSLRKFTPPARLRSVDEERAMWRAARDRRFSHFSTDHAPSTVGQKRSADFWHAPFGLPGIDTTSLLLLDAAARQLIGYRDVAWLYAEAPARRYGLHPRKGVIAAGSDADLVFVDPSATQVLRNEMVRSKAGWTPYAGRQIQGAVVRTFLRGTEVMRDGELVTDPVGEFIPGPGSNPATIAGTGDQFSETTP